MRNNFLITADGLSDLEINMNAMPISIREKIGGVKLTTNSAQGKSVDDLAGYRAICDELGIPFYIGGGTIDEAFYAGNVFDIVRRLHAASIDTIEISNPKGISTSVFRETAKALRCDFSKVLVEVGEKNCNPYAFDWWAQRVLNAEEVEADHIVLEGAFSGNVGIYNGLGDPNTSLVASISGMLEDRARLIIEAPKLQQQAIWLDVFGPDVKLGNIIAHHVAVERLESLRYEQSWIIDSSY